MPAINRLIAKIEQTPVSLNAWLITFFGIVYLRTLIESFSSRTDTFIIANLSAILHFSLFYLVTMVALILITHAFSKEKVVAISKVFITGMPVLLLAPTIDLIISGGAGKQAMAYLLTDWSGLVSNFFTYFHTSPEPGVTTGIRVELIFLFTFIFYYIYKKQKSLWRSVAGTTFSYLAVFCIGSIPSILALFFGGLTALFSPIFYQSGLMQNIVHPGLSVNNFEFSQVLFADVFMGTVLYLVLVGLIGFYLFIWDAKKAKVVIKNFRFGRLATFICYTFLGMVGAVVLYGPIKLVWFDYLNFLVLALSIGFCWVFAAYINDLSDVVADKISNRDRPLISGQLTREDSNNVITISLLLALIGGLFSGYHVLFFVTIFLFLGYIYSCPPLRVKRFMLLNTAIIGMAAVLSFMSGFYVVSDASTAADIPLNWLILLFVVITLIGSVKDLKDYEGDKADGVYTIPVVFGLQRARLIISAITIFALLMIPILSGFAFLWPPTIVFTILAVWLIMRQPFKLGWIFVTSVLYMIICGVLALTNLF